MTLLDYVKNIPLFKHLKDAQLKAIASRCVHVRYRKGDIIFSKTDLGTDLYIVLSGKVKAVLTDEEGDEMVLAQFEPGAFFGELSLLDGKGRSATIAADRDSELAILKKADFFDLMTGDPKIAIELMITLVERLRKADDMIESLAFLEVGERLVRALLEGSTGNPATGQDYIQIKKLTHKELAARIGSSREAVSKCMKFLINQGIVKEQGGDILIAHDAIERLRTAAK